jgi:hypothetical protein
MFNTHKKVHKAVGQFWAELARSFADSPVLPLNATIFAQKMLLDYFATAKEAVAELNAKFPKEMGPAMKQLGHLEEQCRLFVKQAHEFELHSGGGMAKPEWINRRLRKLDQCFMNPALGMAAIQPEKRHVLFSLSDDDNYSTKVMAAVHKKVKQYIKMREKMCQLL